MSGHQTITVRYEYDPKAEAWSALTDMPGMTSHGKTLEDAQAQARDAVASWLELPAEQSLEDAGITIVDEVVDDGSRY